MLASTLIAGLTLALGGLGVGAQAPEAECLRLLGSVACPGFQYAYISPSNLSNAYPFFESVTDVRTFDVAALEYFSNPYQWRQTKFVDQLGCSNATTAMIRYQRTVLCSQWVNERWSSHCMANYNTSANATAPKMVCQDTCLKYSASENDITADQTYCPGPDLTAGNRSFQLNKDYVDCTDWTTLSTNDTSICVMGDTNENNCGYGTSTSQLCGFCAGDTPDECCYQANTDVSVCGYVLPARPDNSTNGNNTSGEAGANPSDGSNSTSSGGLSGGQIAGIVVGSVIGGLLLLLLLVLLGLFCLRRKRRNDPAYQNTKPTGTISTLFSTKPRSNDISTVPHTSSEKGLLGSTGGLALGQSGINASSPTMGGDTLYSGRPTSSVDGQMPNQGFSGVGLGGAVMAGVGSRPGERSSGIVLPRVKDENQNGNRWIETGADVTVLWPYQATLPDELDLRPGMKLKVLRLYDDAWGTAQVISGGEAGETGRQGAFPIVCVSEGSSFGSSQSSQQSH